MAPPPPLQPPLPPTMAADLPQEPPPASGTASPSRRRPPPASGFASPSRRRVISTVASASQDSSNIQGWGMSNLAMVTHQDPMGTSTNHYFSQDHDAFIVSESDRQLNMRQQDPCIPLDETASMEAMKVVSTAVLTMIAALSSYSSEMVAPLAHRGLTQELLMISPYVCIPVALSGAALSFCASESNGIAECATVAVLLVCLFGIALGATAASFVLRLTTLSAALYSYVLMIIIICAWGWLFSYPKCLKSIMRSYYWGLFDRRRSTYPWRAADADPRNGQHIKQKVFHNILSTSLAACRRAFLPLDEDTTINILKTLSPSALTAVSVLSLWAARTVAPLAHYSHTLQAFLYMLPYVYLPLGVLASTLAVTATKLNGLASYASALGLGLCVGGVVIGACCGTLVLHFKPVVSSVVAYVVIVALIWYWGWMLAYPKVLNYAVRKTICLYCARRLGIVPSGRYNGCGCKTCAQLFVLLKIITCKIVLFPYKCLKCAQCWWYAGDELDLEAGAGELEMIPLAVSQ